MTKLDLLKTAVNIVVGAGTSKIAADIIKNNVTVDKVTDVVTVNASAIVIGSMAADATKTYTSDKIDEVAVWWKTNVTKKA